MQPLKTPKRLIPLLAPLAALLLTACGDARPVLTLPPVERTATVAMPVVPAGEAVCDGQPCLSDRETGALIADLAHALDLANAKLSWLHDWITTAGASSGN